MMITISLLVIISTTSIVAVITFNQNQGIDDDAKSLVSELRRVYSRATGIYYPPGCTDDIITGYTVTASNAGKGITVAANGCSPASSESRTGILQSSFISNGATFTIYPGDGRVSAVSTITITSDTNSSLTKQIRMSDFGVIEIL